MDVEMVEDKQAVMAGETENYLSKNLRLLRRGLGFSQEELAGRIGLNRGNIASYENGTAEPKLCNLLKFSDLFKVSIIDLTQHDLSNAEKQSTAIERFENLSNGERQLVEQFREKLIELDSFVTSIHHCFQYKSKSLEKIPREARIMMSYYEQLHDTFHALLRQHQSLIDFVSCKLK
jgi:transcriptional regulator with XRE-family HTH domain